MQRKFISRRSFLKCAGVGAVTAAAAGLLAGCGGSDSTASSASSTAAAPAEPADPNKPYAGVLSPLDEMASAAGYDIKAVFGDSVEFFYSLGNELKIQPDITTYKAGVYPWNAFPSTGVANADGSYDKAQFGMFVCGGWAASMLPDTEKYPRDWKCVILPFPYPEGQEPSTLTVPGCYAVPSTSKNREAAFEAVRCIAENQYTLGYGRVPARVDLSDEETNDYIENGLVPTYAATDGIPAANAAARQTAAFFEKRRSHYAAHYRCQTQSQEIFHRPA